MFCKLQCAAAYLTKPFDLELLLQELNDIAKHHQTILH